MAGHLRLCGGERNHRRTQSNAAGPHCRKIGIITEFSTFSGYFSSGFPISGSPIRHVGNLAIVATITWNGSDGAFAAGGNWALQAAPTSGDTAVITAGTVTASGPLPGSVTINLNSLNSSSPVLILSGATLDAASQLNMSAAGAISTLRLRGTVGNAGTITVAGSSGAALLQIDDAPGGGATNFVNTGLIQVTNTNLQIVTAGSNAADQLENDGVISVLSSNRAPLLAYVAAQGHSVLP